MIAMIVQQRGREAAILGSADPRHEGLITLCKKWAEGWEESSTNAKGLHCDWALISDWILHSAKRLRHRHIEQYRTHTQNVASEQELLTWHLAISVCVCVFGVY